MSFLYKIMDYVMVTFTCRLHYRTRVSDHEAEVILIICIMN